jgi:hypothetical protein
MARESVGLRGEVAIAGFHAGLFNDIPMIRETDTQENFNSFYIREIRHLPKKEKEYLYRVFKHEMDTGGHLGNQLVEEYSGDNQKLFAKLDEVYNEYRMSQVRERQQNTLAFEARHTSDPATTPTPVAPRRRVQQSVFRGRGRTRKNSKRRSS